MNEFLENIRHKLDEAFNQTIEEIHKRLVDMASRWGGKSYLVGGAVRDELMGMQPKDMDYVVTKVQLEDLAKALEKTFRDMGAKIAEIENNVGIVKVVINGEDYEFAVPRIDKDRENVEVVPDLPVEKDLERRDFTFNAIAKDLETGELVEPDGQDGKSDIENKIIKAVGNAKERFDEDPLRMLRALQFAARFGFNISPDTWQAIQDNRDDFKKLSNERFKQEFVKAWTKGNKDTRTFFHLMRDSGVSDVLFGSDFNPIPVDTNGLDADEAFAVQSIAAFLNGGDLTALSQKTEDRDLITVSRWFKNIIDNGISDYSEVKKMKKYGHFFPIIRLAFSRIDEDLQSDFEEIISKPLIQRVSKDSWSPWELPILGGEIESATDGKIRQRAIPQAEFRLIKAYQDGEIEIDPNDEHKSKQVAIDYLKNNIMDDINVKEQVRLATFESRLKNILYK